MIEYKGYTGVFEYDEDYEFFSGHVIDTRDGINFEGQVGVGVEGVHATCGGRLPRVL
jgi:predicted HicB family RNase H-like nuclease